jgi:hypothetical protein
MPLDGMKHLLSMGGFMDDDRDKAVALSHHVHAAPSCRLAA